MATAPSMAPGSAAAAGVAAVTLDELLRTSDYVSIHCPSTEATRGLIGRGRPAKDETHGLSDQYVAGRYRG